MGNMLPIIAAMSTLALFLWSTVGAVIILVSVYVAWLLYSWYFDWDHSIETQHRRAEAWTRRKRAKKWGDHVL